MSGGVVLVGDRDADPLVPALEDALTTRGGAPRVVAPAALAAARLACGADWCTLDGAPVRAVVFRAAPTLLVAPEFGEADAGFAASELRAVWAHVLTMRRVVAVNRAHADTWFSSSAWPFWRRRLAARGVAMAPRRIGRPYPGGQWVHWTGGEEPAPSPVAAERLGAATVAATRVARVLCCAGAAVRDGRGAATGDPGLPHALLREGVVLGEALVDDDGRLVAVETLPAVGPDEAGEVSFRMARWIRAALDR